MNARRIPEGSRDETVSEISGGVFSPKAYGYILPLLIPNLRLEEIDLNRNGAALAVIVYDNPEE